MAPPLQRHDLVWLSRAGWQHLLAASHPGQVLACLQHWCDAQLPVVIGRQEAGCPELAVGLSTPIAWGRRKVSLRVPATAVLHRDPFPRASAVAQQLPPALRARWAALHDALALHGTRPRVHGSYGWQCLTRQPHVLPTSDIDLLLPAAHAQQADAIAACLECCEWPGPRIDGELIFADGSAVAWREWLQWRRGAVRCMLVKRLCGVTLEQSDEWLQCACEVPA